MIFIHRNDDKELDIFRSFQIDKNLPKHASKREKNSQTIKWEGGVQEGVVSNFQMDSNDTAGAGGWFSNGNEQAKEVKKESWYKRWVFPPKRGWTKTQAKLSPIEVFAMCKENKEKLVDVSSRLAPFKEMIATAKANGQKSLIEDLEDRVKLVGLESQLFAVGEITYLTEENIIKFAEICEKGLRLDWIQNFTRIIPADVCASKKRADGFGVYDNYVILHFDPDGKATRKTKAQIAKERDPILFGVIKGSRRLYFIDDWEDELCNLTLDDIAEKVEISKIDADAKYDIG